MKVLTSVVYTQVKNFIRTLRQGEGLGAAVNAYIPLAFELGEAYQFDWSEEGLVVGGIYYRVQVAHMKLCVQIQGHAPQGVRGQNYIRRPLDLLRLHPDKVRGLDVAAGLSK